MKTYMDTTIETKEEPMYQENQSASVIVSWGRIFLARSMSRI